MPGVILFAKRRGTIKGRFVVLSWLVTVLIAMLGIGAGQTIWFYAEPVVDTQPMPTSYFVAAYAGLAALAVSFITSVMATLSMVSEPRRP